MNVQQFDKIFLGESFPSSKGTRWKVKGSPGGAGGLDYIGDNIEDYKRRYEIKTDDDPSAWKGLIELCKTLNETPLDRLEEALKPILDIDGALWFLAIDNALVNNDGYWVRASDYSIFRDEKGKFHIIPHDTNETFQTTRDSGRRVAALAAADGGGREDSGRRPRRWAGAVARRTGPGVRASAGGSGPDREHRESSSTRLSV